MHTSFYIGRIVGQAGSEVIVEADSLDSADGAVLRHFSEVDLQPGTVVEVITPANVILAR